MFQRLRYDWKCEFIPGNLLLVEQPGLERFISGTKVEITEVGPPTQQVLNRLEPRPRRTVTCFGGE